MWRLSGVQWGRDNAWMWNGRMKWSSLKFRGGGEREKGEEVEERRGSGEGLGRWRSDGGTERGWGRWMGWWGTLGPTRRGGLRTHPLYPRRGVCARLFTSHFFFFLPPFCFTCIWLSLPSFPFSCFLLPFPPYTSLSSFVFPHSSFFFSLYLSSFILTHFLSFQFSFLLASYFFAVCLCFIRFLFSHFLSIS